MYKRDIVSKILNTASSAEPRHREGSFFAPSNIALCKYWGKRNTELNLPLTSSLSISLGSFGASTQIALNPQPFDEFIVNGGSPINANSEFAIHLRNFLDLFRSTPSTYYQFKTNINIPIGAGLASSACGYAALVGALNQLYGWNLSLAHLSILARLGSGSACRSFWQGFVEWQVGSRADGMDSLGIPLLDTWPSLRIGLLIFNPKQKILSSRAAMEHTLKTSPFYSAWPAKQTADLTCLKTAIQNQDFQVLAATAESNALAMHALMLAASPAVMYSEGQTVAAMHTVWAARRQGLDLYFTQDAGPNLKLLFLDKDQEAVQKMFPEMLSISPFESCAPSEQVILVDEQDRVIGTEEKLKAHQQALLHRAFSVFVYRKILQKGKVKVEFLLQQRHRDKYHCGGLWTNTCCSHPRMGQDLGLEAQRRLKEEMSLELALSPVGSFCYKAVFDNGLTEHEWDHVFIGEYDGIQAVVLDPTEAQDFRWVETSALVQELSAHPEYYTPWFAEAFHWVQEELCLKF